jgi:hypothetical protein
MSELLTMKECGTCGVLRERSRFDKHPNTADGLRSSCKTCRDKRRVSKDKAWELAPKQMANTEQLTKSKQEYYKKTIEHRRAYNARPERRAIAQEHCERYQKAYPHMRAAHVKVAEAVRKGILKRPLLCSKCNRTAVVQGHHHDYDKPLEVTWLCIQCHHGEHVALRASARLC